MQECFNAAMCGNIIPDFLRKWVREYVPIVFVAVEVIQKNKKMEISIF